MWAGWVMLSASCGSLGTATLSFVPFKEKRNKICGTKWILSICFPKEKKKKKMWDQIAHNSTPIP
jgi:hypothetical protein